MTLVSEVNIAVEVPTPAVAVTSAPTPLACERTTKEIALWVSKSTGTASKLFLLKNRSFVLKSATKTEAEINAMKLAEFQAYHDRLDRIVSETDRMISELAVQIYDRFADNPGLSSKLNCLNKSLDFEEKKRVHLSGIRSALRLIMETQH